MNKLKPFVRHILLLITSLVLFGSLYAAFTIRNDAGVTVTHTHYKTAHGEQDGYWYKPKGLTGKRPVIILTNGFLDSKESQANNALELARRGFIVLTVDLFEHGHSKWHEPQDEQNAMINFWLTSQWEAVQHVAQQDFTLKDDRQVYIGVSGHSMGGFSSLAATYFDEEQSIQSKQRLVHSVLAVGADFSYLEKAGITQDDILGAMGNRPIGIIAGKYDEFFFNKTANALLRNEPTIYYKEPISHNPYLQAFLGYQQNAVANQFYTIESPTFKNRAPQTAQHIVYTPSEVHQQNLLSYETTGNLIDFFEKSLGSKLPQNNPSLTSSHQIWLGISVLQGIALISFLIWVNLLASIAITGVLSKYFCIPFSETQIQQNTNYPRRYLFIILALSYIPFFIVLNRQPSSGILILLGMSIILLLIALQAFFKRPNYRTSAIWMILCSTSLIILFALAPIVLMPGRLFNNFVATLIAYWTLYNGLIIGYFQAIYYQKDNKTFKVKNHIQYQHLLVFLSLILAIAVSYLAFQVLASFEAHHQMDLRFWLLRLKAIDTDQVLSAIKLMPFFFVFYFFFNLLVHRTLTHRDYTILWVLLLSGGGVLAWLILQYGGLWIFGQALVPTQPLWSNILLVMLINMVIMGLSSFLWIRATNQIWYVTFFHTIFFTLALMTQTNVLHQLSPWILMP